MKLESLSEKIASFYGKSNKPASIKVYLPEDNSNYLKNTNKRKIISTGKANIPPVTRRGE